MWDPVFTFSFPGVAIRRHHNMSDTETGESDSESTLTRQSERFADIIIKQTP